MYVKLLELKSSVEDKVNKVMILLITRMITEIIGRQEVQLPINQNYNKI